MRKTYDTNFKKRHKRYTENSNLEHRTVIHTILAYSMMGTNSVSLVTYREDPLLLARNDTLQLHDSKKETRAIAKEREREREERKKERRGD